MGKDQRIKRWLGILVALMLCWGSGASVQAAEKTGTATLRVIFTTDLQAQLTPTAKGRGSVGGYSRLASLIAANKTDSAVVLDTGNYSQGSLFTTIGATDNPGLKLMGTMGYDATTLGSDELAQGVSALAKAWTVPGLTAAHAPMVLASNLTFGKSKDSRTLKKAYASVGRRTKVIHAGKIKVGVFGLMGKNAAAQIADSGDLSFADPVKTAKSCVTALKKKDVDCIICLFQGGGTTAEAETLADKVDGINAILLGGTGRALADPLTANNAAIVAAGTRGEKLGVLDLNAKSGAVKAYGLVPVTEKIKADETVAGQIADYQKTVQKRALDAHQLNFDTVIARSNKSFVSAAKVKRQFGDADIENLLTDAYRHQAQNGKRQNVIGIAEAGGTRGSLSAGDLTAADLYQVTAPGEGSDHSVGASMIVAYLTGEDLRNLCELDLTQGKNGGAHQLFFSGLRYTYDRNRTPMNQVTRVQVQTALGRWQEAGGHKRYAVTMNWTLAKRLSRLAAKSKSLVSVSFETKTGKEIQSLRDAVLTDQEGREVKDWQCLVTYLKAQAPDASGKPVVPAAYNQVRKGKIAVSGTNVQRYLGNPSRIGWLTYGVVALAVILVAVIVALIVTARRRGGRRQSQNYRRSRKF
ncbi:bifunctional metallophosphatase/5'-nucleotidase [Pseudoramibacter faecis]|uniref:bifunctional metallophosphatase/5'-nucleotidase n=1 Tax=Pseudoramibacter faecis TaxID=3108534 RepID=UPI002E78CFF2|nr:5'-nucleotidase C-terminal domain-containing protein [Pseudoramibacter sp. HA2172]